MTDTGPRPRRAPGHRFKGRALTAVVTAIGFVTMMLSGLVLFIVPSGRIARMIEWSFAGLSREDWISVHIAFAILFVVIGVIHLGFNWRAMRHHLATRLADGVRVRPELVVGLVLSAVLLTAAVERWPPFDYLFELHKAAKSGAETGGAPERPWRGGRFERP
jgi:ABC-type Fe3+-siderophore transport system permease subunit